MAVLRACAAASGIGKMSLVKKRMDSIKYQQILGANIRPQKPQQAQAGGFAVALAVRRPEYQRESAG